MNINVDIRYNNDCEMMEIINDEKCIFFGNYDDFDRQSKGLKEFLELLGLKVNIKKDEFNDLD